MTTRTKLNITINVMSVMMFLNVFSKPLRIPDAFQWILTIGVFVPITFMFYLIRVQKREKAAANSLPHATTEERKNTKQRLVLIMSVLLVTCLSAPLWLPLTGTTMGPKRDFIVGLIAAAISCSIVAIRLRKA